ncbi:hypothetical protein [Acetobacter sp.]|uniref:hypothetical protein n=1 Tax=Acetobacter sp. TaxID=440 RepID=UPI0039EC1860
MPFLDMAFPINHTKFPIFPAEWEYSDPYPDKPCAEDVLGKLYSSRKKAHLPHQGESLTLPHYPENLPNRVQKSFVSLLVVSVGE